MHEDWDFRSAFGANADRYESMLRKGWSVEQVAAAMVADDLAQLKRAETESEDRRMVERLVAFAAKELKVAAPRVRFFRSEGLPYRGTTSAADPSTIWVAADKPWYEQGEIALHELGHLAALRDGLPHEQREIDAQRFAERGRRAGWIRWAGAAD